MMGLERLKHGRGRLVANTVAATMALLFSSTIYHEITIIQKRSSAEAPSMLLQPNPTEDVLMARRQLEASLMGTYVDSIKSLFST